MNRLTYESRGSNVTVEVSASWDKSAAASFRFRSGETGPFTDIGDVPAAIELIEKLRDAVDRVERFHAVVGPKGERAGIPGWAR